MTKINSFAIFLLVGFSFLFSINSALASPFITNANIDDGVLTISGSDFGSHADNNTSADYFVYAWDNLDAGQLTCDKYNSNHAEISTDNKTGSSYSARNYRWVTPRNYTDVNGDSVNYEYMYKVEARFTATPQSKLFMSMWIKFDDGFDTALLASNGSAQTKIMGGTMIYNGDAGPKTYFQTRNTTPNPIPLGFALEDFGTSVPDYTPRETYVPEETWHRLDIFSDVSGGDGNKHYNFYIDGMLLRSGLYNDDCSGCGTFEFIYASFGFYFQYGDDTHVFSYHTDDFFTDFTQARVEISDNATWDTSSQHHLELQIPTAWSDTGITANLNQASLPSGIAYLYIVDENGEVNASGYPITIGSGSADTTAPNAPTNLSVL